MLPIPISFLNYSHFSLKVLRWPTHIRHSNSSATLLSTSTLQLHTQTQAISSNNNLEEQQRSPVTIASPTQSGQLVAIRRTPTLEQSRCMSSQPDFTPEPQYSAFFGGCKVVNEPALEKANLSVSGLNIATVLPMLICTSLDDTSCPSLALLYIPPLANSHMLDGHN